MRLELVVVGLLMLSVLVPSTALTPKKCTALNKADIDEKLGHPVPCSSEIKDYECFGDRDYFLQLEIDESGRVKSMTIRHDCNGVWSLKRKLEKILPEKSRGKLVQKTEPNWGSCEVKYTEKYECLTIDYFEIVCTGCAPASVTLTWK